MNIIIAGGGKVGMTLARQLAAEGHDLTIIDHSTQVLDVAVNRFDAISVTGNCASREVLERAGIAEADLVIAATGADELNLLCCMTAHGVNPKIHTIARIRNPEYAEQIMTMPETFPVSMTFNPEKQAALEIERLLKYPGFLRRDTFAKGRTEIVELRIDGTSPLKDLPLSGLSGVIKCKVLVCAVLRAGHAIAPSGNFILREGDRIFVTAPAATLAQLLKNLGIITKRVREVLICGGGRMSYYLAKFLEDEKMTVRILERDYDRCLKMADWLPNASIIHGDCSSHATLEEQGIAQCDAVVTLTGIDETNMVISMYAVSRGVGQVITKLSHGENTFIADSMALGSLVVPRELCSSNIVRYVRAMENQVGAAVTLHTIADGQVEAIEFMVDETTKNRGVPLKKMKLRPNVLLASITHGRETSLPGGDSEFQIGDTVLVVTSGRGILHQLNDIFA